MDDRRLARDLGIPVVATAARYEDRLPQLLQTISEVASGELACRPHRLQSESSALSGAVPQLAGQVEADLPGLPNARWVALCLLDGDIRIETALRNGELGTVA